MDQSLDYINDFIYYVKVCPKPIESFPHDSVSYELAKKWIRFLSDFQSSNSAEKVTRNFYLWHLVACMQVGKLMYPFLQMPQGKLQPFKFFEPLLAYEKLYNGDRSRALNDLEYQQIIKIYNKIRTALNEIEKERVCWAHLTSRSIRTTSHNDSPAHSLVTGPSSSFESISGDFNSSSLATEALSANLERRDLDVKIIDSVTNQANGKFDQSSVTPHLSEINLDLQDMRNEDCQPQSGRTGFKISKQKMTRETNFLKQLQQKPWLQTGGTETPRMLIIRSCSTFERINKEEPSFKHSKRKPVSAREGNMRHDDIVSPKPKQGPAKTEKKSEAPEVKEHKTRKAPPGKSGVDHLMPDKNENLNVDEKRRLSPRTAPLMSKPPCSSAPKQTDLHKEHSSEAQANLVSPKGQKMPEPAAGPTQEDRNKENVLNAMDLVARKLSRQKDIEKEKENAKEISSKKGEQKGLSVEEELKKINRERRSLEVQVAKDRRKTEFLRQQMIRSKTWDPPIAIQGTPCEVGPFNMNLPKARSRRHNTMPLPYTESPKLNQKPEMLRRSNANLSPPEIQAPFKPTDQNMAKVSVSNSKNFLPAPKHKVTCPRASKSSLESLKRKNGKLESSATAVVTPSRLGKAHANCVPMATQPLSHPKASKAPESLNNQDKVKRVHFSRRELKPCPAKMELIPSKKPPTKRTSQSIEDTAMDHKVSAAKAETSLLESFKELPNLNQATLNQNGTVGKPFDGKQGTVTVGIKARSKTHDTITSSPTRNDKLKDGCKARKITKGLTQTELLSPQRRLAGSVKPNSELQPRNEIECLLQRALSEVQPQKQAHINKEKGLNGYKQIEEQDEQRSRTRSASDFKEVPPQDEKKPANPPVIKRAQESKSVVNKTHTAETPNQKPGPNSRRNFDPLSKRAKTEGQLRVDRQPSHQQQQQNPRTKELIKQKHDQLLNDEAEPSIEQKQISMKKLKDAHNQENTKTRKPAETKIAAEKSQKVEPQSTQKLAGKPEKVSKDPRTEPDTLPKQIPHDNEQGHQNERPVVPKRERTGDQLSKKPLPSAKQTEQIPADGVQKAVPAHCKVDQPKTDKQNPKQTPEQLHKKDRVPDSKPIQNQTNHNDPLPERECPGTLDKGKQAQVKKQPELSSMDLMLLQNLQEFQEFKRHKPLEAHVQKKALQTKSEHRTESSNHYNDVADQKILVNAPSPKPKIELKPDMCPSETDSFEQLSVRAPQQQGQLKVGDIDHLNNKDHLISVEDLETDEDHFSYEPIKFSSCMTFLVHQSNSHLKDHDVKDCSSSADQPQHIQSDDPYDTFKFQKFKKPEPVEKPHGSPQPKVLNEDPDMSQLFLSSEALHTFETAKDSPLTSSRSSEKQSSASDSSNDFKIWIKHGLGSPEKLPNGQTNMNIFDKFCNLLMKERHDAECAVDQPPCCCTHTNPTFKPNEQLKPPPTENKEKPLLAPNRDDRQMVQRSENELEVSSIKSDNFSDLVLVKKVANEALNDTLLKQDDAGQGNQQSFSGRSFSSSCSTFSVSNDPKESKNLQIKDDLDSPCSAHSEDTHTNIEEAESFSDPQMSSIKEESAQSSSSRSSPLSQSHRSQPRHQEAKFGYQKIRTDSSMAVKSYPRFDSIPTSRSILVELDHLNEQEQKLSNSSQEQYSPSTSDQSNEEQIQLTQPLLPPMFETFAKCPCHQVFMNQLFRATKPKYCLDQTYKAPPAAVARKNLSDANIQQLTCYVVNQEEMLPEKLEQHAVSFESHSPEKALLFFDGAPDDKLRAATSDELISNFSISTPDLDLYEILKKWDRLVVKDISPPIPEERKVITNNQSYAMKHNIGEKKAARMTRLKCPPIDVEGVTKDPRHQVNDVRHQTLEPTCKSNQVKINPCNQARKHPEPYLQNCTSSMESLGGEDGQEYTQYHEPERRSPCNPQTNSYKSKICAPELHHHAHNIQNRVQEPQSQTHKPPKPTLEQQKRAREEPNHAHEPECCVHKPQHRARSADITSNNIQTRAQQSIDPLTRAHNSRKHEEAQLWQNHCNELQLKAQEQQYCANKHHHRSHKLCPDFPEAREQCRDAYIPLSKTMKGETQAQDLRNQRHELHYFEQSNAPQKNENRACEEQTRYIFREPHIGEPDERHQSIHPEVDQRWLQRQELQCQAYEHVNQNHELHVQDHESQFRSQAPMHQQHESRHQSRQLSRQTRDILPKHKLLIPQLEHRLEETRAPSHKSHSHSHQSHALSQQTRAASHQSYAQSQESQDCHQPNPGDLHRTKPVCRKKMQDPDTRTQNMQHHVFRHQPEEKAQNHHDDYDVHDQHQGHRSQMTKERPLSHIQKAYNEALLQCHQHAQKLANHYRHRNVTPHSPSQRPVRTMPSLQSKNNHYTLFDSNLPSLDPKQMKSQSLRDSPAEKLSIPSSNLQDINKVIKSLRSQLDYLSGSHKDLISQMKARDAVILIHLLEYIAREFENGLHKLEGSNELPAKLRHNQPLDRAWESCTYCCTDPDLVKHSIRLLDVYRTMFKARDQNIYLDKGHWQSIAKLLHWITLENEEHLEDDESVYLEKRLQNLMLAAAEFSDVHKRLLEENKSPEVRRRILKHIVEDISNLMVIAQK